MYEAGLSGEKVATLLSVDERRLGSGIDEGGISWASDWDLLCSTDAAI